MVVAAAAVASVAVEAGVRAESAIAGKRVTLIELKGCHGIMAPFFISIKPLIRPFHSTARLFLHRLHRGRWGQQGVMSQADQRLRFKRLSARGASLVGRVARYENLYRLCYITGPEGILIGLAEELVATDPDAEYLEDAENAEDADATD